MSDDEMQAQIRAVVRLGFEHKRSSEEIVMALYRLFWKHPDAAHRLPAQLTVSLTVD